MNQNLPDVLRGRYYPANFTLPEKEKEKKKVALPRLSIEVSMEQQLQEEPFAPTEQFSQLDNASGVSSVLFTKTIKKREKLESNII